MQRSSLDHIIYTFLVFVNILKLLFNSLDRDRLFKELDRNVALKVSETGNSDTYEICGRGQLHLTVKNYFEFTFYHGSFVIYDRSILYIL